MTAEQCSKGRMACDKRKKPIEIDAMRKTPPLSSQIMENTTDKSEDASVVGRDQAITEAEDEPAVPLGELACGVTFWEELRVALAAD